MTHHLDITHAATRLLLAMSCALLTGCDFIEEVYKHEKMNTPARRDFSDAVYANNLPKVREYIESGKISVHEAFAYGQKPLHIAAYSGKLEIIKYLVQHGSDINAEIPDTFLTPLHITIRKGHEDAALLLLDLGADPSINFGRYTTCCHVKRMRKWVDMQRLIARLPGCKETPFDNAHYCQQCSR